jgi:glycosyltransferase involved in cell wall biosynthesis
MRLIICENGVEHVSNDTLEEFEDVILLDSQVTPARPINPNWYKFLFFIYRLGRKLGFSTIRSTIKKYIVNPMLDSNHLFTVMMGLDIYKYRPYGLFTNHNRSIFLFDAWPDDHQKIADFANQYKIDYLFVTASQAAQQIKPLLIKTQLYWIPEGINPTLYKQDIRLTDKTIDVLALGRKYDKYHLSIVESLTSKGINYKYEKKKGEIIFPTRDGFINGLADSKISICVPSSITHFERSGDIETMTIRYLQSMVSKCIVLGHAPAEMIDLFGYNPVVEIDYANPVKQITDMLENYESYIPLIEKNYNTVVTEHTWQNRWDEIKKIYLQKSN